MTAPLTPPGPALPRLRRRESAVGSREVLTGHFRPTVRVYSEPVLWRGVWVTPQG